MTAVRKINSNSTGLSYAIEDSPGHVPSDAVWLPLEPNSYKSFGGEVKTKARMPINASRQLKKGVVVDLDASAGWQQDLTYRNFQDLSQCFFFAALRTKGELAVAVVDNAAHKYEPAAGGDTYFAGDLLFAKDFADSSNNGLKVVSGTPDATDIVVTDTNVVSVTGQTGTISRVGYKFGAGEVKIDVATGPLPRLKLAAASVAATGALTTTGTFSDAETVTIGGKVYTLQSVLTNTDGHVLIGGSTALTLTNLKNAINRDGTNGVPGTDFATATTANPRVTATSDSTHLNLTARVSGTVGNAITTTETCTNAGFGGGTLSGGSGGRGLDSFGLIPGEFVFVGGDATTDQFFTDADNGFCRIRSVHNGYLEFDKTQGVMTADDGTDTNAAGTGQTIRIYFGRVIKNESDPTKIVLRSIQLERQLGAPDDAQLTQIQAEYLQRCIANEVKFDVKQADILRMELDFLANKNELRSGATGLKPGSRPAILDSDAFNATSDVAFTKMAIVTAGNAAPTALFSFFTDLSIDLKNNVKQDKAVGVLGAFDSTPGFFQVSASLTAYFTDVAEMQAVIDNASVTLETHLVKFNQGITMDLPLLVLSKALADAKINEPVMIPLASDAATAKIIDPALDHTMLWVFWDYLPTLAG